MKKMKKLLALVCAMLMLVSVIAGCSAKKEPAADASATPTLDAIRERGELILGTESTYPPFEFIVIEDGQSVGVGMDVSLAQAIADKLGV